jgi:phage replication-related protein YjqB (UPF0714/DUF867 family)
MVEKMEECIKKKHIQDSYSAQIKPIDSGIPNNHIREHCLANLGQIYMIGRDRCEQVRIERPTATGTARALYTVIDVHDEEPDVVFVDKNPDDLWNRLELSSADLSSADHFPGKVNAQVTAVGLTDAEAEASSEFIENLADNGHNHGLIVIAPHGGNIEKYTDEQAEHVGQKLSSEYVSEWICKGFKKGGGAFNSWHITSTDISEESFPKLNTIMRRHFEYSVAFHGWDGDSICIGGSSAADDLKPQIKKAIEGAVPHSIVVTIVKDDDDTEGCPKGFNGNSAENIVNRLSTKGLQIEQCERARKHYGIDIADAVADVIGPIIKV